MSERGRVHEACKWCYQGIWGILTPYFKLPKEPPHLPSVEGEAIEYLHPSEAYLRYQKFKFWIALFVVDVLLTVGWIALFVAWPLAGILVTPLALAIIILPDIIAYIAIHLNYDTTWYVLSDRSMRLRRGVWSLHETTITFDNIQNVHVQQGPIQRWFGFSNLHVQTAGGGGGEGHGAGMSGAHVGFLEGMSNAEEIRERILARCGRGAGLGEEAHEPVASVLQQPGNHAFNAEQVELLRSIRDLTSRLAKT
ncbi:MAG: PH domain-containing protein [Pirellula sp.]|jgi:membrane protein YdbS with pleckstrin-like domain|nr:PH domain-containing protein [Pirellula sp.]